MQIANKTTLFSFRPGMEHSIHTVFTYYVIGLQDFNYKLNMTRERIAVSRVASAGRLANSESPSCPRNSFRGVDGGWHFAGKRSATAQSRSRKRLRYSDSFRPEGAT
jgi:hypothetical protein